MLTWRIRNVVKFLLSHLTMTVGYWSSSENISQIQGCQLYHETTEQNTTVLLEMLLS